MKRSFFLLITGLLCALSVRAQSNDSIRISLMTCSPGQAIYELFGHTAIRVEIPARKVDIVFNYGLFSFNAPNFLYRFVKGETDYQLGVIPYVYFAPEYARRGSYVIEQELNLTSPERERLLALLDANYRPENRVYRYNYFYDNCTTRARDKIEESIDGRVIYPVPGSDRPNNVLSVTYREMVHQYTQGHSWDEFGIDLCLGAEADQPIDIRQQMFAPFFLMEEMDDAVIRAADGSERPLVTRTLRVVEPSETVEMKDTWLTPMICALFVLVVSIGLSLWEWYSHRKAWWFDILLFGLQGLTGCIIAFLFFFSIHPTVGSNYLLIFLNPIPLFYLPRMIYLEIKRRRDIYHVCSTATLTLFIVFWWLIPQKISLVMLPLALSLLVRSVTQLYITRKETR